MKRFVQSKDVAWNHLGENIIAFNLTGDRHFHDLNPTAAFLFQNMQSPKSEQELLDVLLEEFEVSVGEALIDVAEAVSEMHEKQLIIELPLKLPAEL